MTAILSLLTSRLAGPIAAGAAALLLVLLISSRCTVADLADDLRDERAAHIVTKTDLGTCRGNTARLQTSLEAQSAAVAALEAAGRDATARAEKAVADARVASTQARRSANALLALQPVGDECQAALILLRTP